MSRALGLEESMKRRVDPAKAMFVGSSALVIFAYGVAVGVYKIFPFNILKFGVDSIEQVWDEGPILLGAHLAERPEAFLKPARHEGDGVTRMTEGRTAPGLTLLAGFFANSNEIRLIRQDGAVIKRWPVRFTEIFPNPNHIEPAEEIPATDWNTDIHGALAFPDGSIVFNFEYKGMVKLDRCGNVQWTVPRMTHHSIDWANDGNLWVGGRRYVKVSSPELLPLEGPYQEDTALKISPEGEILAEISVPRLFFENGLEYLLLANGQFDVSTVMGKDIVHLNDIEQLSPDMADRFPQFVVGDLLLSMRELNLIMVVDPETERVKWHQTGPWIRQHDPDFTVRGTISVFNNNTDDNQGKIFGGSTIVEMDPGTREATVLYGARPGQDMYTSIRGKHQHLENGNILITESISGRVIEIDDQGEIVWEYINRFDDDEVARLNDAIRYPEGYFSVEDWACN
jgi:hypothetical protein